MNADQITEAQARFILSHNFTPTDFMYDPNKSPIDNVISAIEMYGDRKYEDGSFSQFLYYNT